MVGPVDFAKLTAPCNAAFGGPVEYQPQAGGSYTVNGIFDEAYLEVKLDKAGSPISSRRPICGVQSGDLAAAGCPSPIAAGDTVTIAKNGKTYEVNDYEDDSHGWTILKLNYVRT